MPPLMHARRAVIGLACLSVLATSVSLASATPPSGGIQLVRTKAILPGLANAQRLGEAPSTTMLTVGLGLAHPYAAQEAQLYKQLYKPSSPLYRHFLTPQQYQKQYAVPVATERAAAASHR